MTPALQHIDQDSPTAGRAPYLFFFGNPLIYSAAAEKRHGEEGHHRYGHHEAHHGGTLNVIGEEAGHIEIRISGDIL